MEVEVNAADCQGQRFVLKPYDPRFATQLREDEKISPFTTAHEEAYESFVESAEASAFLARLQQDDDFCEPEDEPNWDLAQNEVYLYSVCLDMYEAECAVYDRLKELQGKGIPQLYAKVALRMPKYATNCSTSKFYSIKGILLEHIPGFTLAQLTDKAPREFWQKICNEAVRLVQICNDQNILNKDIRTSNFIVSLSSAKDGNRVVLIDFAQCRLRGPNESDSQWGRAKWIQDEEGAIGLVMKSRLHKVGFELEFNSSLRYLDWAPGEND